MAGNYWSITIVAGETQASFVPDVYIPPGGKFEAQPTDVISWNNQTHQEHQIWQTGGGAITAQIAPGKSSSPGYVVPALPPRQTSETIQYYCSLHPAETGSFEVVE